MLGTYYLIESADDEKVSQGSVYRNYDEELVMAYTMGKVSIHAKVKVFVKPHGVETGKLVSSTVGRFIFNEQIPQIWDLWIGV